MGWWMLIFKFKSKIFYFQHICFISSRKVQNWNKKKICAVYGEDTVTDWTRQKWFAKFCAGDFLLDDAPWSDRPVEVDSDQIKTLTENNQQHFRWEIANILKISKSIKLLVKMKNVFYFMEKNPKWTFWPTQYLATPIEDS